MYLFQSSKSDAFSTFDGCRVYLAVSSVLERKRRTSKAQDAPFGLLG
jgi:hypothetical protein